MATVLTAKDQGIFGVLSLVSKCCLFALKGFACIAGGIGGCIILAALLLPIFLIVSFLLRLIIGL
jgi:hypothetical protein